MQSNTESSYLLTALIILAAILLLTTGIHYGLVKLTESQKSSQESVRRGKFSL